MKKLIVLVSLLSCQLAMANPYDWKIKRIIDGDTVVVAAPWLPDPLKKELAIRVYGVDTPEKGFRAKCAKENALGVAASQYTKKVIEGSKKYSILINDWDKYGGRVLGDVIVDGKSLRELLIANGMAREYHGEAKQSWCT